MRQANGRFRVEPGGLIAAVGMTRIGRKPDRPTCVGEGRVSTSADPRNGY